MRSCSSVLPTLTRLAVVAVLLPLNGLTAQASRDVRYTEVTRFEFGGRLGRVLRVFGGGKPVTQTHWYSGPRMRTDNEKTSGVTDAKAGTVMTLEHDPRTYWLWSVNDPMLVVETIPDSTPPDTVRPPRRRAKAKYTVTLSTDRSGERQTIVGLEAEQVGMTLQIDGETYNEDADSTERSTLMVLSELWLTPTFPGTKAEETFNSAWDLKTSRDIDSVEVARAAKAMEQAYAEEPRLRIAVNKLDSAMATLKGYSLKTFSHYVIVPDGAQFDREKVLRDAEKGLVADLAGSAAKGAMNEGRARLGRMAGGRLGGRLAGGGGPRPEQIIIMRTRREITELATDPIPADKFLPPPGYKRRTPGTSK